MSIRKVMPVCTKCFDSGVIIVEVEQDGIVTEEAHPCPECFTNSSIFKRLLGESGIPKEFWNFTFSDYHGEVSKEELDKVQFYLEHLKDKFIDVSLYLFGKHSCQKSTVMSVIGKQLLKKGYRVYYILAGDLIDIMVKSSGFETNYDVEMELDIIKNIDFLLIDDVFDSKKSMMWKNSKDMIVEKWDRLFRYRYDNQKRFIMTSNISLTEATADYGESIVELIGRYSVTLEMRDSIKAIRTQALLDLFKKD